MNVDDDIEDIENGIEDENEDGWAEPPPSFKTAPSLSLNPESESHLLSLWAKRTELYLQEVCELYQIVQSLLLSSGRRNRKIKSLIDALPYELEDYIADFLAFKIFQSPGDGMLDRSNVLTEYFRRFLISQLRKEHIYPISDPLEDKDSGEIPLSVVFRNGCNEIDPAEILTKTLDDPRRVAALALEFLHDCPVWARLFLRFHDCADPDDGKMMRGRISADFKIPSYQQKAWKLGVVIPPERQPGGCLDSQYYAEKTLIGRWMRESVGIAVEAENAPVILACFKILCQAALKHVDGQGELK